MAIGAIIGAGASILGGLMGSGAASDAAGEQAAAARYAADKQAETTQKIIDLYQQFYDQSRQDLAPYMGVGYAGLEALANEMGFYRVEPDTGTGQPQMTTEPIYTTQQQTTYKYPWENPIFSYSPLEGNGAGPDPATGAFAVKGPEDLHFTPISHYATTANVRTQTGTRQVPASDTNGLGAAAGGIPQYERRFGFRETPGYNFRFNEALRGLDSSGSARGMSLSGPQAKGITDYVYNNIAAPEYGQYMNNLGLLAGYGTNATGTAVNTGQNYAGAIGGQLQTGTNLQNQYGMDAATATASGYVGSANAWSGALNDLGRILGRL